MVLSKFRSKSPAETDRRRQAAAHLLRIYRTTHGKEPSSGSPSRFSEKLLHRLLTLSADENPLFSRLSDKLAVRDFVRDRLGDRYLTRLLWSGTETAEIPFDTLPSQYVIKANHGSGMVVRVEAEPEIPAIIAKTTEWLKTDYGLVDHEHHYSAISPSIAIEEFVADGYPLGPLNYSFWSFCGEPAVIQVDNRNQSINPFYDISWNKLPLTTRRDKPDIDIAKPPNLDEMLMAARKLAMGIDFVRVDLYSTGNRVYFGEMTFTPGSGRFRFLPEEWDETLGALWKS